MDKVMSDNQNTPLHEECILGNLEEVKFLINRGVDVSAVAPNGYTPLHYACSYGNLEVVKLLIDHGADVSALDRNGYTPLESLNSKQREVIEEYIASLNFLVKPGKR
jgi:ankyrin repeat protein